jgi:two-component system cell cycle response regulator DivK
MAGERILIVDDHPINLKLVRIILEEEGYEVRTAEDAESVFEVLESFAARLILMDLQLPGMDGLELTRRLRQQARFEPVWIVALSAYALKGDAEKAQAAGCDGYLTKPIDAIALPGQVAVYLQRERSAAAGGGS